MRAGDFGDVAGNFITSIIAAVTTFVVLWWWLNVPAGVPAALIAGISDFVPVVGFVVGAFPTILLALTGPGNDGAACGRVLCRRQHGRELPHLTVG